MECCSTWIGAQSIKSCPSNAPVKFFDAGQVGLFFGIRVIYDYTEALHLNLLASSGRIIRSTSGDYLDLINGIFSHYYLEYSDAVVAILKIEPNATLESYSTIHAQSKNSKLSKPFINILYHQFVEEADSFLRFGVQAIYDKIQKEYIKFLAFIHIESTPKGSINILEPIFWQLYHWYSNLFINMFLLDGNNNYAIVVLLSSPGLGECKLVQNLLNDLDNNMMNRQIEGSSRTTSTNSSGRFNSSSSSSESNTSGEGDIGGNDNCCNNDNEGSDDSSSSNEYFPGDNGEPGVVVSIIPLIEQTVDGMFLQRAQLRSNAFSGYGSLARLIRQFSPYNPADSIVHILWPWVEHIPVYVGVDNKVLNPRAKWQDFASKLKEIHMLPMEDTRPAFLGLPGIPMHVPGLPSVDLEPFYWLRFLKPSISERVFVIRRSAIHSYHGFFWIIHGLWASWHDSEPQDAKTINEANVVREGSKFFLFQPDKINFFDHSGTELEHPKFLTARLRLEKRWQRRQRMKRKNLNEEDELDMSEDGRNDKDEENDEYYYPDDDKYENIWDFLTQVLEIVITWSVQHNP